MDPPPDERHHLIQQDEFVNKGSAKENTHIRTTLISDSVSDLKNEAQFDWKPVVLRKVPLVLLLLVSVAIIGALQYAAVRLPHVDLHSAKHENIVKKDLGVIQEFGRPVMPMMPRQLNSSTSSLTAEGQAPPSDYVATTQSIVYSSAVSAYVATTQVISTFDSLGDSAYVATTQTISPVSPMATQSDYVATTQTVVSETTYYVANALPLNYITTTQTIISTDGDSSVLTFVSTSILLDTATSAYVPGTYTSAPSAYVPTISTDIPNASSISTHVPAVSTTTSISTYGPNASTNALDIQGNGGPQVIIHVWTPAKVFVSSYLPLIVAVVYRLWWTEVHDKLALIDPFRHLSQPGGGSGAATLLSAYQKRNSLLQPLSAIWRGRWALFITGVANLSASLLPALASEALWIDTNWNCPNPDFAHHPQNPCFPRLTSSVSVIRVLQVVLACLSGILVLLAYSLYLWRTGLGNDPSSLACIATLMQNRSSFPWSIYRQSDIKGESGSEFKRGTFYLGAWLDQAGHRRRGIQAVGKSDVQEETQRKLLDYSPTNEDSMHNPNKPTRYRWRYFDIALVLLSSGTFAVVLAYRQDGNDDSFNRFFNSNSFGPRFILTFSVTIIANLWKNLEHELMTMAPFNRLYSRNSLYQSTLGFCSTVTPLVSTWKALRNGYWLAALVTLIALLVEALQLVISDVPYATGLLWSQFTVSVNMSISILALVLVTILFVMFYRRGDVNLPIEPTTIAAKMSYLAGSRIEEDFEASEWESDRTRDARMQRLGKKYRLRVVVMPEGSTKWLVTDVVRRDV